MNRKERETEIRSAVSMIKKQQAKIGKPGSRLHEPGMADRAARLRALEIGPCGECRGLKIEYKYKGNLVDVSLRCRLGGSPLELHRLSTTGLGEVPDCSFSVPFEE